MHNRRDGAPEDKDLDAPASDTAALGKATANGDASLPSALILGDSISIGYAPMVIERLKGAVNVAHAEVNCGDSNNYLRSLDKWLGGTRWDVVHFNAGLHDLCHRHPDSDLYGHRDKVNGTIAVPLDQYGKNLESIVARLKKSGARLIWASTTFVPEGEAGRFAGDEIRYNEVARKVMERHGVPVNDLHALSSAFPKELFARPADVHFGEEGSRRLAGQVSGFIKRYASAPEGSAERGSGHCAEGMAGPHEGIQARRGQAGASGDGDRAREDDG